MKTGTVLFSSLLSSLASTVASVPVAQAPDALLSPRDIVYLTIFSREDMNGDYQTLELSTDSCHNLSTYWRNNVRSAYSYRLCYYYGKVDCQGRDVAWTNNGGDPSMSGVYSVRCPL